MTNKEKGVISGFVAAMVLIIVAVVAVAFAGKNGYVKNEGNQINQGVGQAVTETAQIQSSQNTTAALPSQSESTQQTDAQTTTPASQAQSSQQQTSSAQAPSQSGNTALIGEQEAKSIALTDSGQANNTSVVFTKQKLDYDDGLQVYEVEFHDGITEWEYEINASTGDIVSKSSEPYEID